MLKINIVYRNNNMPGEVLSPIEDSGGKYRVVWSRRPLAGSDVVVYFNHYVFSRRLHRRICPDALKVLYMYEPPAVDPMQYTERVWKKFDRILTWNTYLTESSPLFTFEPGAYYELPYCSDYGVASGVFPTDPEIRKRAICQICGDKYSLAAEEIYSERRKVARWFHEHASVRMDVYGRPPMHVPNYRGECADKAQTMSQYRYALCFENTYHPVWTHGYLTEKILDCMACGTVPVYYGCSNIDELVPPDCFIDYRRFEGDLKALDEYLRGMSDEEYLGYVARMKAFLAEYNAPLRHSAHRLYETVAAVAAADPVGRHGKYPRDYVSLSSWNGRLRLQAMRILFPLYRFVYPIFSVVRLLGRVR